MNELIKKVKSTRFSKITTEELFELLKEINTSENIKEIYDEIFPILLNNIYENTLLNKIYNIPELNDYCIYLLYNKIDLSTVDIDILIYFIYNTPWGKKFFLDNIDIISKNRIPEIIRRIYNLDISLYNLMLNSYKSKENKLEFITYSVKMMCISLEEDTIIESIRKDETTLIPNNLGYYLAQTSKYKNLASTHKDILFESANNQKFRFLSLLNDKAPELCEEYKVALKLYELSNHSERTDSSLSNLINFGNYNNINKSILTISPDLQITPISINKTSTNDVFGLGSNNILKLGTKRYTYNIDLNFFRIIPTKVYYIRNKSGQICSVIEFQPNIYTDPNIITLEMIKELFLDFMRHGLYIADPNCLKYEVNDFGLLRDYRDANLGQYKSHEDLPESFKRYPLVLLDVDLVYRYDGPQVPPITMLDNITNFHSDILDYGKIKQIKSRIKNGGKL